MGVEGGSPSRLGRGIALGAVLTLLAGATLAFVGPVAVSWKGDVLIGDTGTGGGSPSPVQLPDFASTYEDVADGVVRLAVDSCDSSASSTGSGALVDEDMVLTAAHVVSGYWSIQLQLGDQTATGFVIGYSQEEDLALVKASRPLQGHIFDVHTTTPSVGTEVVALGYPLSGPLSLAGPGSISALEQSVTLENEGGDPIEVANVMRITTPTNPGNSGGPVIDVDGRIACIVSSGKYSFGEVLEDGRVRTHVIQGFDSAIPADVISGRVDGWLETNEYLEPLECDEEEDLEPLPADLVVDISEHAEGRVVEAVFFDYFDGVNRSDYERAYRQLSDRRLSGETLEDFQAEQSTSIVSDATILGIEEDGEDLRAQVTFRSTQSAENGPDGLTCAFWTLEYRLVPGGEYGWAIDSAHGRNSENPFEACT